MKKTNKKHGNSILFISTIILLVICGIAFNSDINKGLFKEKDCIQPIKKIEKMQTEQFSPAIVFNWVPVVFALIIIVFVILVKERRKNRGNTFTNIADITKDGVKYLMMRIDNIKGMDVGRIIRRFSRVKPHKKIKEHYYMNVHPHIHRETTKTRDLFIEQYKDEYTDKFIALLFIVAVIGMSVFALTPSLNPGLTISDSDNQEVITGRTIQQQAIEQFSPEQLLNILPLILALIIIALASFIRLREEK